MKNALAATAHVLATSFSAFAAGPAPNGITLPEGYKDSSVAWSGKRSLLAIGG